MCMLNYGLKSKIWAHILANIRVFVVVQVKDGCILRNLHKIGAFLEKYLYRCNVQILGNSGNPEAAKG